MKLQVIHEFNEALFLDKHYFPPHGEGTPIVIDTKKGIKRLGFLYIAMRNILMSLSNIRRKSLPIVYALKAYKHWHH